MIPQPNPHPWPGWCGAFPYNSDLISTIVVTFSASLTVYPDTVVGSGSADVTWNVDDSFPCWTTGSGYDGPGYSYTPPPDSFGDCGLCCGSADTCYMTPASGVGTWSTTFGGSGTWELLCSVGPGTNPGTYSISITAIQSGEPDPSCTLTADNIASSDIIGSHELTETVPPSDIPGGTFIATMTIS